MRILALSIASLLAACSGEVGASFTPIGPIHAGTAILPELLLAPTERPHVDLGIVDAWASPGFVGDQGLAAVLAEARRIGATYGCEALVVSPATYERGTLHVSSSCIHYRGK
jgi:hypothetical protein